MLDDGATIFVFKAVFKVLSGYHFNIPVAQVPKSSAVPPEQIAAGFVEVPEGAVGVCTTVTTTELEGPEQFILTHLA